MGKTGILAGVHTHAHTHTSIFTKINNDVRNYTVVKSVVVLASQIKNNIKIEDSFIKYE